MYKRVLSIMVALALLWIVGCSESPTTERDASEKAIQAAQDTEAETYAPAMYQMALDTLEAAKLEMSKQDGRFSAFRSYGKSRELFATAQRLADEAVNQAATEKERIRVETSELMVKAETALANALTALKSAPTGKGTKADIAVIKADLEALQQSHRDAKAIYDQGNFLSAKARFEVIIDRADSIVAQIEAAKSMKTSR